MKKNVNDSHDLKKVIDSYLYALMHGQVRPDTYVLKIFTPANKFC